MAGRVAVGAVVYAVSGGCLPIPRTFAPVLVLDTSTSHALRAGSDETSTDPTAIGADFLFEAGGRNVYTFFGPVLDTDRTTVTGGSVKDVTFSLEGDRSGWSVDKKTGTMTGTWPVTAEAAPGQIQPFVMHLVAWDVMKESAVIETFTVNVRNPVFSPVLALASNGLPLRPEPNGGSTAPNLNALGSEYWYTAGEQNAYTINSPTIDPTATVLVTGTLEDITFSLAGDSAGWTVDEKTGSMDGSWPFLEGTNPSVFIIDLVATDADGTKATVETFTMNVENPTLTLAIAACCTGYTEGTVQSYYLAGESNVHTISGPVFDPERTALTKGTIADLTFSLTGQSEGWTVDDASGMMKGAWPYLDDAANPSTYMMQLVATDARGETAEVKEFALHVRNPVFTPIVGVDVVTGLTLRAGADGESIDPQAVGEEHWYFSEHAYKIFPPRLDANRTVVTAGATADITFSLRSVYGLSSGWTVDENTGVMTGAWPFLDEQSNPSLYIMNLVGTDARGKTAVIERIRMHVKNPTFEPVMQTDADGSVVRSGSDGGIDPRLVVAAKSWYLTGVSYTVYPPAFDPATTVSQGTLADVTYELSGQSNGWAVDAATGLMTGAWPRLDDAAAPAVYTMQLVAVDLRGQREVIEEMVMDVRNPTTTTTSVTLSTTTLSTTTLSTTTASSTTSTTTATVSTTTTTVSTSTSTVSGTSSTVSTTTTSYTDTATTKTATRTSTTQTSSTVTETTSTTTATSTTRTTATKTSTSKTKTTRTTNTATSSTRTRTTTSKTRTTRTKTTTTRTITATTSTGTTTSTTSTTRTTTSVTTTTTTKTTTVTSSTTLTTTTPTTTTLTTTTRTTTSGTSTTVTTTSTTKTITTTTTIKLAAPVPADTSWLPIVVGAVFGVLFLVMLISLAVRLRRGGGGVATRSAPTYDYGWQQSMAEPSSEAEYKFPQEHGISTQQGYYTVRSSDVPQNNPGARRVAAFGTNSSVI